MVDEEALTKKIPDMPEKVLSKEEMDALISGGRKVRRRSSFVEDAHLLVGESEFKTRCYLIRDERARPSELVPPGYWLLVTGLVPAQSLSEFHGVGLSGARGGLRFFDTYRRETVRGRSRHYGNLDLGPFVRHTRQQ